MIPFILGNNKFIPNTTAIFTATRSKHFLAFPWRAAATAVARLACVPVPVEWIDKLSRIIHVHFYLSSQAYALRLKWRW